MVADRLARDPDYGRSAVERIVAADTAAPPQSIYDEVAAPVLAEAEASLAETIKALDALDEAPPFEDRN